MGAHVSNLLGMFFHSSIAAPSSATASSTRATGATAQRRRTPHAATGFGTLTCP